MLRNNAKTRARSEGLNKPILKNVRMRKFTKKPAMQIRENAQRNAIQSVCVIDFEKVKNARLCSLEKNV
jgi:hypothetical protein